MDKISSDSSEPLLGDSNEPVVLAPQESIWRRLRRQWALLVVMALLLYNAILVTLNALHKHPELDPPYCVNVRVTKEEMMLAGENLTNTAQLLNGDYLAVLGVYHQIHCLDILRKGLHMDYYSPKMTDSDRVKNMNSEHYDHCVERLRRTIMCHADLAIYSAE
ncbi:hypothetical protein OEA41_006141 [Lepraria neglecta]|uniref:Uncharacterized protein n=1 Tax=Lepraria neglecta TaxID=209136 RepID=A0AAD9Z7B9_9LECA|nr:hypothetical protein OEA41_006141 [Lepraria neglecta]